MLNIPDEYDRDTSSAKFKDFFANSFHRYLVSPLQQEMIKTQMGTHNRSENGYSAWGALYDTTALTVNSKQKVMGFIPEPIRCYS
jgi:hypothetical protein